MNVLDWLPVATLGAGCIIWAIRQEGRVNNEREARQKLEDEVKRYYATKEEVTRLEGAISAIATQLPDIKALLVRVEGKVDSFLVAAVRNSGAIRYDKDSRGSQ